MPFQKTVNAQFTPGFPGEIVRDGMLRAGPGRIASASLKNVIGRAFGYTGETGAPTADMVGQELPVNPQHPTGDKFTVGMVGTVPTVSVGAANFYGILGHPKHYALSGTPNGSLEPTLAIPTGTEGEFIHSTTGMVVEIFNPTTTAIDVTYGMALGFMKAGTSAADNPQGIPDGALVPVPDPTTLAKGVVLITSGRILTQLSLGASAANKPTATSVVIQLTQ